MSENQSESETRVAEVDRDSAFTQALAASAGIDRAAHYCSLTPRTERDYATLQRILGRSDKLISDLVGQEFAVVHVSIQRCQVRSQATGDMMEAARLVLVGADGVTASSTGSVLVSSFLRFALIIGEPPYDPPLRIKFKSISLRSGGKGVDFDYLGGGRRMIAGQQKAKGEK